MLAHALLVLVSQDPVPAQSDVAQRLDELIAKTNELSSFYARYRVTTREAEEEPDEGWLELAYVAPDRGAVRMHAGEVEFEVLLVGDGVYALMPDSKGPPRWGKASFRSEEEAPEARRMLDERFPNSDSPSGDATPSMVYGCSWNGMKGVEQFQLDLRLYQLNRHNLLDWLPRMKRQADEMTLEGDQLLWSGKGFECRLSAVSGLLERLEATNQKPGIEIELLELLLDEIPETDPFSLSEEARAAPDDPRLEQMDPNGLQMTRGMIYARVAWLLHREERAWDEETRSDWEALLKELHRETVARFYADWIEDLRASVAQGAERLREERRRTPPPEPSELDDVVQRRRESLVETLEKSSKKYLDSIPQRLGPLDEGSMPEELFTAEREAAGLAFDEFVVQPLLAAYDEETAAALND